ncbi:MAG TPA: hypothetical protein VFU42_05230 [Candidatus Deferrimicrobiaceae bacterium]|nr:hypothetical protein [Candidatus Deferrimicrobiaceae bacterium]
MRVRRSGSGKADTARGTTNPKATNRTTQIVSAFVRIAVSCLLPT